MDLIRTYKYIRSFILEYGNNLRNNNYIHDTDFLMSGRENERYVEFGNLLDLGVLFYELYINNKTEIVGEMENIMEKQEIADDSDIEDIIFYHHAYFFLKLVSFPEYYHDIIEALKAFGAMYYLYQENKSDYDSILLMEGCFSLNL